MDLAQEKKKLTVDSSLRALRAGCTHYGLSTTGSKVVCIRRLWNHQKQLELQVAHSSAEQSQRKLSRAPRAVTLQILPDETTQQEHFLLTFHINRGVLHAVVSEPELTITSTLVEQGDQDLQQSVLTLHTQRGCQSSIKPRTLTLL